MRRDSPRAPATLSRADSSLRRQLEEPYDPGFGVVEEEEEPEERVVQTKPALGSRSAGSEQVASHISRLGSGAPLPTGVRSFMEHRFGHDFSRVKIHIDRRADQAAASVNARAFTLGRDIVFAAGQWAPEQHDGRRLLAHELAHVVQQGAAQDGRRSGTIRRMRWHPNRDLGRTSMPWGSGPSGRVLEGRTDGGTPVEIWSPHDGATYWCHGYTFGGVTARGGPYSVWGSSVMQIVNDDGWHRVDSCVASPSDIALFFNAAGQVAHSGIIRQRASSGGVVDEIASQLQSKWGNEPLNTSSWLKNIRQYGKYRCYSKAPAAGPCASPGANELP